MFVVPRRTRRGAAVGLILTALVAVGLGPGQAASAARVPAAAPASLALTAAAGGRPNIVTVMADDMRVDDLRYMPAVRRLVAGTGLRYRNSFSPDPLCCPARASFLTGLYSHNHGVLSHEVPWGFAAFDDHASIATALQGSGYRTAFVGKYLNGYGSQPSRVTGESSFRYVPAGWTDWYAAVSRPEDSGFDSGGTYNYFNTLFNVNGTIDDSQAGRYQTSVLGGFARALVTRYSQRRAPFFLYLSSVAPHHGTPREPDDPVDVPSSQGGTVRLVTPARPSWVKGRFDAAISRAPGVPLDGGPAEANNTDKPRSMRSLREPSPEELTGMRDAARQRAESLYVLDGQIARLVATLKRTGEWRNTVFMFTSDNGYFLGEHRVRQGKIKAYEPSLRVPFVITGPGIPRGTRFDPVSTVDVSATIAELAGAHMPYRPDGRSIVASFQADRGWTVPVVTEGHEDNMLFPSDPALMAAGFHDGRTTSGLRTPRYKFVRYSNGDVELYDLDRDPTELRNVAAVDRYADTRTLLQRMWVRLRDCAAVACREPMPRVLQRTPAQNKSGTDRQSGGVEEVYGYWR